MPPMLLRYCMPPMLLGYCMPPMHPGRYASHAPGRYASPLPGCATSATRMCTSATRMCTTLGRIGGARDLRYSLGCLRFIPSDRPFLLVSDSYCPFRRPCVGVRDSVNSGDRGAEWAHLAQNLLKPTIIR